MPNADTPHSRALRAKTATHWNQERIKEGGMRVTVILPKETAEALTRLTAIYGTKTAAMIAAIESLDQGRSI
ncbi:MAG: hypothetical protein KDJ28_03255 [Candidatus Competibacteraceae bacterium]|nr:hypothetical protein [Candidatus Competibacteraceae bacterium]